MNKALGAETRQEAEGRSGLKECAWRSAKSKYVEKTATLKPSLKLPLKLGTGV